MENRGGICNGSESISDGDREEENQAWPMGSSSPRPGTTRSIDSWKNLGEPGRMLAESFAELVEGGTQPDFELGLVMQGDCREFVL